MGLFTSGPQSLPPIHVKKEEQKRKRVQFQESLRRVHWTTSPSLLEFKSWLKTCEQRYQETITLLWQSQFVQNRSWTKPWLIRVPTMVVLRLLAFSFSLVVVPIFLIFIYPVVALVKLSMTYVRFLRISSKELAKFDQKFKAEETSALRHADMIAKIREREKQLRNDRESKRENEELAKKLATFWFAEFQKSSTEVLLEAWAVLQQFPSDHNIYYLIENSPGPILRWIVDREVQIRSITVEARQLALLRLESKVAFAKQSGQIERIAAEARQDAQKRDEDVMGGLMAIAMLQLMK
jgi:hypothetical protein